MKYIVFGTKLQWNKSLDITDILFGIQNLEELTASSNYIILESKYLLYRCNLTNTPLSALLLIEKKRNRNKREAGKRNKRRYHYENWEPLLPLVSLLSVVFKLILLKLVPTL